MGARAVMLLLGVALATASAAAAALPGVGFVENRGQMEPAAVRFAATVPGGRVWIEPGVVAYEIAAGDRVAVIHERVAPPDVAPAGLEPGTARVNDLRGTDPARWRRDVPTWRSVSLGAAGEGVALRVEARVDGVEKIFTLAPGARPQSIASKSRARRRSRSSPKERSRSRRRSASRASRSPSRTKRSTAAASKCPFATRWPARRATASPPAPSIPRTR